MALHAIKSGLRTIHNGSNDVIKVDVAIPAGSELTLPDGVAETMLAANTAWKDGPPPKAFVKAIAEREAEKENAGPVMHGPDSHPSDAPQPPVAKGHAGTPAKGAKDTVRETVVVDAEAKVGTVPLANTDLVKKEQKAAKQVRKSAKSSAHPKPKP